MKKLNLTGHLLVLILALTSSLAWSHGTVKVDKSHENYDEFLAAMVRAEEQSPSGKLSRIIESTLEKLPVNRTLSEIIDVALGKEVVADVGNNPSVYGQWSELTQWPFAFASAANLPDGRILTWGGNHSTFFNGGSFTYAATWNPANNQITQANNDGHSMFCGVPVMLEDGRVFVAGGNGQYTDFFTSTFDYKTESWTHIDELAVGRWYNGSVFMSNGQVFTALGEPGSNYPELWTEGSGWSYLNGIDFQSSVLDYPTVTEPKNWLPHLHLTPNGKIFHSGHTPQMNMIDPTNEGSIQALGITNDWNTANTPSVFYDEGKILQSGGRLKNTETSTGSVLGKPTTNSQLFDLNNGNPALTMNSQMHFFRIFHNEVVLPNGEVLVIGGNNGTKFSDTLSQMTPEIWNPQTKSWRIVSDLAVPRNYHSVALLMTDGRVWSGGGGLCDCSADHPNSQVFSPPYLFKPDGSPAVRPVINSAPSKASFGNKVIVSASSGVNRFSLVRMSSTTHALNSDMRFLNIPFVDKGNGQFELSFHTNRNVMVPGYWMLFALNSNGVPSIAKVINITTSNAPVIENPGDQNGTQNNAVNLAIDASDPNGDQLKFKAIGLPAGLSIDSFSGVITGIPSAQGNNRVTIFVSDQNNTASITFIWNIAEGQITQTSDVFGSSEGNSFSDSVLSYQSLIGVDVYSSGWINAIQGILNNGSLNMHGTNNGDLSQVRWPTNEYLVRIYGRYGEPTPFCFLLCGHYVGQISFVTNTGRVFGPYGNGFFSVNAAKSFDITVPAGQEIIGFTGRASNSLNAIGVIYRKHGSGINKPPIISTIFTRTSTVGQPVNFVVSATDPEGDGLTYSATGLPSGLVINSSTGLITGSPTQATTSNVTVQVKDTRGGVSSATFNWITSVELPLSLSDIDTQPQTTNSMATFVANVNNGINPLFKWSFGDGSPESAYSSNPITQHIYTSPGLFVVKASAKDDRNVVVTKTFIQAIHLPHTTNLPSISSNVTTSLVNGVNFLWVVNKDNDTVSVFNADNYAKLAEIIVGKSPRSIAVARDGNVWVTNKGDNTISVISPTTYKVQQKIPLPLGSQPFGIAFSPTGEDVYVVLEAVGKLLKLNPATGALKASLSVGVNVRQVSISADGSRIYLPRYITKPLPAESTASVITVDGQGVPLGGEIVVVNAQAMTIAATTTVNYSDKEDTETEGAGVPNYLAMLGISPDGTTAWVPSKQDNILRGELRNGKALDFQNTVRAIASKVKLSTNAELYDARLDFDNSGVTSAVLFDQSGNYLFFALETTREIVVVDAYGGRELRRIQVGLAPDGLALSSDGTTLFVNNFMDRTISVIDLTNLLSRGDWQAPVIKTLSSVGNEKLSTQILKGKQLFYDAKDTRLARDGYLSCAVCHDDASHDGRTWDFTGFGEGLRNTIDLRGRRGTGHGFVHWTGNFDEIQDFEGQIRRFAGGTGLMSDAEFTATQDPLGASKAGRSTDLDALSTYLKSLDNFYVSPFRNANDTLTSDALIGKSLYNTMGCIQCHQGEPYTDSSAAIFHNVGTINPTTGKRLGLPLTGLDTPTLRDVWNTGPYLHDGSALTLQSAIRAHTNIALTDIQLNQLSSFISQIGGTEEAADNLSPTVAITYPATGLSFIQGTPIQLNINAADADGTLAKVEVYAGSILLKTFSSGPFTYFWSGALPGNYTLTAKAFDNNGSVTTSSPVVLTVISAPVNQPPKVVVTSPSNTANFISGVPINLLATAQDSDGTVAKVEFYAGNSLLSSAFSAPYSFNWVGAGPGNYIITAKAYDNKGAIGVSSNVAITVSSIASNQPPIISITSPLNSSTFSQGAIIGLKVNAIDPDGTVNKVEYYSGNNLLKTVTVAPYSFNWTGASLGNFVITAKAYDNKGLVTTSTPVSVSVNSQPVNQPPLIAITSPVNASNFTLGTIIPIKVNASDTDGLISKVEFYSGNMLLKTLTVAPYTYNWTTTSLGNFVITAKAYDNKGLVTASTPVNLSVINNPINKAPVVSITSPLNSSSFNQGVVISLKVAANDPDGTVTKVDYYSGSNLLKSVTSAPFTFDWTGVPIGNYALTAKAFDNKGLSTISNPVNITVKSITNNQAPTVAIISPSNASTFGKGSVVDIAANASDTDGTIGKVEFYLGNNLIETQNAQPFQFKYTANTIGNFVLTAKAYDNKGLSSTSNPVTFAVTSIGINQPPKVVIASPTTSTSYSIGATIPLAANASDADGTIAKVEFYAGTTLLKSISAAPFTFNWVGASAGTYALTAKAYDDKGLITVSNVVSIIVKTNNQMGLLGQYFNNLQISGQAVLQRRENIDFKLFKNAVDPLVKKDGFSVRWSGQVIAPESGEYRFKTTTDDGVRLYFKGTLVINDWKKHGEKDNKTAVFNLVKGQKYSLVMEYFDLIGAATANLSWLTPGNISYKTIPAEYLSFP